MAVEVYYKQTVEVAIRHDTNESVPAPDLLRMDESEFTRLRREATKVIVGLRKDPSTPPLLTCAICDTPLWVTRRAHPDRKGNRFFKHARAAKCPWYLPSRYSAEQIMAIRFHREKEGAEHKQLKAFIARMMSLDPLASDVVTEKTQWGRVMEGTWKRPDVSCTWSGKRLVLELQLSYTFISEVVKRDLFYQAEGTFVIWVFKHPDEKYAFVKDEKYFNKRNLFVLDDKAREESERRGRLVLNCFYTVPIRVAGGAGTEDVITERLVELSDLQFPHGTFRPYVHDYDCVHERLQNEIAAARAAQDEERKQVAAKVREFRRERMSVSPRRVEVAAPRSVEDAGPLMGFKHALIAYGEHVREASHSDKELLLQALEAVPDTHLRKLAKQGMEEPYIGALLRIASVECGRPLVTQYPTVYQVLDAALQVSARTQTRFAVMYLEACAAYRLLAKPKQVRRLCQRRNETIAALRRGDEELIPPKQLIELVATLFPKLWSALQIALGSGDATVNDINGAEAWASDVKAWSVPSHESAVEALNLLVVVEPWVDWLSVLKQAYAAYKQNDVLADTVNRLARVHRTRPGQVADFLVRCSMVRTVPKPTEEAVQNG